MTDNRTTELLRKLLDERGVKWTSKPTYPETTWAYNGWWHNAKFEPWSDSTFKVTIYDLTPEQAIAATLGSDASAVRLAERLCGIADEMRNVGASSMTPHELLACYASDVDKVADSLTFAATLGSESVDYMLNAIGRLEEENERLRSSYDTLTAEQVREAVLENFEETHETYYDHWEPSKFDWQAIADELNAELGSGKAKDLLLRTFGLAQMMHDCWLEECKAGDNVDVSACNAYSYEFDQIAQAMFDMGTDPNDSDYYRSAELGSGTCRITASATDGLCSDNPRQYFELSCGHSFTLDGLGAPVACAVCGKAVER